MTVIEQLINKERTVCLSQNALTNTVLLLSSHINHNITALSQRNYKSREAEN